VGEFLVPKRSLYLGFRLLSTLVLGHAAMDAPALVVGQGRARVLGRKVGEEVRPVKEKAWGSPRGGGKCCRTRACVSPCCNARVFSS
jgi:hypothetical protein